MTTQHTPGPWTVSGRQVKSIDHGKRYTVATANNRKFSDEANASNASLIAAAPDLLNMLRNAENWFREYDVQNGPDSGAQLLLEDIRAAITKATGAA